MFCVFPTQKETTEVISSFKLKITAEYKHWQHIHTGLASISHKFQQVFEIENTQQKLINNQVFFSLEFMNIFTSDGG